MIPRGIMMSYALNELDAAYRKHGSDAWGRHEFYSILLEEVEELWDIIKHDGATEDVIVEMSQIIAIVLRYAETGNRYSTSL